MPAPVPSLKVVSVRGRQRALPLWNSASPRQRRAVVYMVKTLPDGVRLAFNRDYELIGAVRASAAEWEAALIHCTDTCADYSINDQMVGDAVWFEVCSGAREAYRRSWIEKRAWDEERQE